mmetsp:Transcript_70553/g.178813  ORF Transcript_70553/g.178813 Transcript_70553/m.178813 type:complete len:208 (-) Transcript_70553:323-946(-)
MCEASELQPLREEGEDGPRRRARCTLAQDQHEGRDLEERPHLRHIVPEDRKEARRPPLFGEQVLVRLRDKEHDAKPDNRTEGRDGCHTDPPHCDAEDGIGRERRGHEAEDCVADRAGEEERAKGKATLRRAALVRQHAEQKGLHDAQAHSVEHSADEEDLEGPCHRAEHEATRPEEHAQADEQRPRQQLADKATREGEESCRPALRS